MLQLMIHGKAAVCRGVPSVRSIAEVALSFQRTDLGAVLPRFRFCHVSLYPGLCLRMVTFQIPWVIAGRPVNSHTLTI